MQKALLFDFDGTLANTLPFITDILTRRSQEFGLSHVNESVITDLKDKSIQETLRSAGISLFKLPFIIKACQRELHTRMHNVGLSREDLPPMLRALKRKGYILGVVTSNSKENVERFFQEKELGFFDFIYSGKSLFGKGRIIRHVLKTRHLNPELTFYIGDETRDVEAARQAGIASIAVSWGFNSRIALETRQPDFLVRSPKELLEVVQNS